MMPALKSRSIEPQSLTWAEASDSNNRARKWTLDGKLNVQGMNALDRSIRKHLPSSGGSLTIDLGGVSEIDSIGTALLVDLWRLGQSGGFKVQLLGVNASVQSYLELYRIKEAPPPTAEQVGVLEGLGERSHTMGKACSSLWCWRRTSRCRPFLRSSGPGDCAGPR